MGNKGVVTLLLVVLALLVLAVSCDLAGGLAAGVAAWLEAVGAARLILGGAAAPCALLVLAACDTRITFLCLLPFGASARSEKQPRLPN
jgi:hypothetical protein